MDINPLHFEKLLIESVRYCLGRTIYVVGDCADIVRNHWKDISKETKQIIRCDISEAIEEHNRNIQHSRELGYAELLNNDYSSLGKECDAFVWIDLLNWIDEQEKRDESI